MWVETMVHAVACARDRVTEACGCGWPHADRHASHVYSGSQTSTIQNIKGRFDFSQKEQERTLSLSRDPYTSKKVSSK